MTKVRIGEIAVDSGQIMIVDPCYINADFAKEFDMSKLNELDESPTQNEYEMNYDGCCNATLNKNGYGAIGSGGLGLACRTLWGDGGYPVYAEYNDDGGIKTLTIDFDPEFDVCDHCGESVDVNSVYGCSCNEEHWED